MSLFDFVSEEDKADYEVQMPDVAEFDKEELLAFEREILGVYVSGHPLDDYASIWKRHISAVTTDFEIDDETGEPKVKDQQKAVIGGMLMGKTVKTTKTGQIMAFLTLEDLVGTVEVVVFPRVYQTFRSVIEGNNKIFVTGRVNANADENGKLIADSIESFDDIPVKVWIRFADMQTYLDSAQNLENVLKESKGKDKIIIYCAKERSKKELPASKNVNADEELLGRLYTMFGRENVETT
jgi:DNA polymerase-3 subunit alpha